MQDNNIYEAEPGQYPDNPPWTMFFDGPLYQRYDEFMRGKDFSKILLSSKLKLANLQAAESTNVSVSKDHSDFWDFGQDAESRPAKFPLEEGYPSEADEYYRQHSTEEKRRTRRTRACIWLTIVIMAALAFGTALVIHYFFIPNQEEPKNNMNISLSGNTSFNDEVTTPKPENKTRDDVELTRMLDDLQKKIDRDIKPPEIDPITTTMGEDERNISTPLPTTPIDPLDFFGMDEFETTTPGTIVLNDTKTEPYVTSTLTYQTSSVVNDIVETNRTITPHTNRTTTLELVSTTVTPLSAVTDKMEVTTSKARETVTDTTVKEETTTTKSDFVADVETTARTSTVAVKQLETTATTVLSKSTTVDSKSNRSTVAIFDVTTPLSPQTSIIKATLTTTRDASTANVTTQPVPSNSSEQSAYDYEYFYDSETTTSNPSTNVPTTTSNPSTNEPTTTSNPSTNVPTTTSSPSAVVPTPTTATIHNVTSTSTNVTTTVRATSKVAKSITTQDTDVATYASQTTDSVNVTKATAEQSTSQTTVASITTPEVTTALPEHYNTIQMSDDVTAYTSETVTIICSVQQAIQWTSVTIAEDRQWLPLEVTLYPSNRVTWSSSKTSRHDVIYDVTNNSNDRQSSNITLQLFIKQLQCLDGTVFSCFVKSDVKDDFGSNRLTIVGKPNDNVDLILGPSVVENKALRITAKWQGGFPIPWTNLSWTATDRDGHLFSLMDYGSYRDYKLFVDNKTCQTTLEHSLVIFPQLNLNDTTIIVKPNITKKRTFVDHHMEEFLNTIQPGQDKLLVIPLSYCKLEQNVTDKSIPHPYTQCTKFVRCLPDDLVVQSCPTGTCFSELHEECVYNN